MAGGAAMKNLELNSSLAPFILRFVDYKRSQGYSYNCKAQLYRLQFLDNFAHDQQWTSPHLNSEFCTAYSDKLKDMTVECRAPHLSLLRNFSKYLHRHNPDSEVYMRPVPRSKPTPGHIYSEQEVQQLLTASSNFRSECRAYSFTAMISLMSATGLRPGEAVNLKIEDFDPCGGTLFIRKSKLGKDRLIPIAASTVKGLSLYLDLRDQLASNAKYHNAFFLNCFGMPLLLPSAESAFRELLQATGIKGHSQRGPRLHDWRHTYAVNCLVRWHREGVDVNARLPVLATYLGHVGITETQYYLQATPELMASAAQGLCDYIDINQNFKHTEVSNV